MSSQRSHKSVPDCQLMPVTVQALTATCPATLPSTAAADALKAGLLKPKAATVVKELLGSLIAVAVVLHTEGHALRRGNATVAPLLTVIAEREAVERLPGVVAQPKAVLNIRIIRIGGQGI